MSAYIRAAFRFSIRHSGPPAVSYHRTPTKYFCAAGKTLPKLRAGVPYQLPKTVEARALLQLIQLILADQLDMVFRQDFNGFLIVCDTDNHIC